MEGKRSFKILSMGLLVLLGAFLLNIEPNKEYSNSFKSKTYLSRVDLEDGQESGTYLGVAYLDPTNLETECNYANSVGATNGDKTGCMRFYIFEETDTTYKLLLDHNTTNNVEWIKKEDYVNSFETDEEKEAAATRFDNRDYLDKGPITLNNQLAVDTAGWAGNPRLLTAADIKTLTGNSSWDLAINDVATNPKNIGNAYGWLLDKTTGCSSVGCVVNEPNSGHNGYWTITPVTGTTKNVWAVQKEGKLLASAGHVDSTYGVRPYIELSKDVVDGAFKLTNDAFENETNGVSVYEDAYCLTAGKYQLEEDITLSKSIALTANCGLDSTTDVVIDLNGNTLTLGDYEFATEGPNLNITGSGEIVGNVLILDGTVTLDDSISYTGTIDIRGGETTIDGISVNSTTNALVISEGATVTINHGDFTGITCGLLVHGGTIGISSASFAANAYAVAITNTMSFEDLLVNSNVFNDTDITDYVEEDGFKKLNTAETSVGIKTTYTLDFDTYNVDENGRVLFTNDDIEPGVEVKVGDATLVEDTDYTVEYKNNKNVGEASVVIKRISTSAYTFANKTLKFEIYKIAMDMDKLAVTVTDPDNYVYTGSEITPTFTLTYDGNAFDASNFDLTAENNTNAGTATYTLTLKESSQYSSESQKTFTVNIKKKDITVYIINGGTTAWNALVYTGSAIIPEDIKVQYQGDFITDYTVEVTNNINVGTGTITVTSEESSNYNYTATTTFTINPKILTANDISLAHSAYEYTGLDIEPDVVVTDGEVVVNKSQYVVTYTGNSAVGTADAYILNSIGSNYTINVHLPFEIVLVGGITEAIPEDNLYNVEMLNEEDSLNSIIPLTLDDTCLRAEGATIKVLLEAKNITNIIAPREKASLLESLGANEYIYQFVDINLYKQVGNNEKEKITKTNASIKIRFELPESILNNSEIKKIFIAKLHNDVVSLVELKIEGKYAYFETDEFSTYALAYKLKATQEAENTNGNTSGETTTTADASTEISSNPKTGDSIINSFVVMGISLLSMVYLFLRKRNKLN